MLNSCDFQGRFAADPELRTTQTGKQVASFRMAVDRDMVDANGHRPTDWLIFTAWGKTADRQQVFPQGERRCGSFPLPDAAV